MIEDFSSFYKVNNIQTANSGQLILILYNHMIKILDNTINIMKDKSVDEIKLDFELLQEIHKNITSVYNIVMELIITLDFKNAKEISEKYKEFYLYIIKELIQANLKKDIKKIKQIRNNIFELKEVWKKVLEKEKNTRDNKSTSIDFSL